MDGDKDKFNWAENDEYYYNKDEILCCLEPPYPINNRMTMVFSENNQLTVKNALEKTWRKKYAFVHFDRFKMHIL